MKYKFYGILIFICTGLSCQQTDTLKKTINEWQNKEIIFVDSLYSKINGRDTIPVRFDSRSTESVEKK